LRLAVFRAVIGLQFLCRIASVARLSDLQTSP
jgi:hypothetical protein